MIVAAQHGAEERREMQQQALYVVNDLGRERFIWATSAAEARAHAAAARRTESAGMSSGQTLVLGTASPRLPERRVRHEAAAER